MRVPLWLILSIYGLPEKIVLSSAIVFPVCAIALSLVRVRELYKAVKSNIIDRAVRLERKREQEQRIRKYQKLLLSSPPTKSSTTPVPNIQEEIYGEQGRKKKKEGGREVGMEIGRERETEK